jgi:RecB family endonuclease NucS
MGGPWRDEGFDPVTWKPPVPHVEARTEDAGNRLTVVVFGYVAAVVLSVVVGLTLLKLGW